MNRAFSAQDGSWRMNPGRVPWAGMNRPVGANRRLDSTNVTTRVGFTRVVVEGGKAANVRREVIVEGAAG